MIHLHCEGPIARLVIDRPQRRNALNAAMWQALREHCDTLAQAVAAGAPQGQQLTQMPEVPRVLVLEGAGGVFCAGSDIEEMVRTAPDRAALAAVNAEVSRAQRALEALPVPTLAAIDGPCFGGGFGLAACCDFRVATTRSSFAVTPARLGLVYSLEDTRTLVRLVGDARARRLLLAGEQLDGATALAWGVLDALVEPAGFAQEVQRRAQALAQQSRASMAGLKATLASVADPADAALRDDARRAYEAAFGGADFREGTAAFLERRPPRFG